MKNDKLGIIILSILLVIVITVCFLATGNKNNSRSTTTTGGDSLTEQATRESEAVKKSEMKDFSDITVSDFSEFYNDSTSRVVLFSRPGCGYCQIAEPILKNIAYKYDLEIYHINTDDMSEEDFNKLKELNNEEFASFGTPLLVVVSNNEIVDDVSGLTNKASYIKFFKKNNFIKK